MSYAAQWFLCRFYYRYLHDHLWQQARGSSASSHPISVVVPAITKDVKPLKLCLAAANQLIRQPIRARWVVGPESIELRIVAAEAGWDFVCEDRLLPRPASELNCRGWVLQQFVKFGAAFHVPTEDYLVLDADTVFVSPQEFVRGGKTVLRYSDQYELLYGRSLRMILGNDRRFPVSFVTHHMMFNRETVKEMLEMTERRFEKSWWLAFLEDVDRGHLISFSEFELYGNYVVNQPGWTDKYTLEYWHGLDRDAEDLPGLQIIKEECKRRVNTVSFHWHTQ